MPWSLKGHSASLHIKQIGLLCWVLETNACDLTDVNNWLLLEAWECGMTETKSPSANAQLTHSRVTLDNHNAVCIATT